MYIYRCTSFYISTYIFLHLFIYLSKYFQNVLLFLLIYLQQGVPINLFESLKIKKYTKYLNAIRSMYLVDLSNKNVLEATTASRRILNLEQNFFTCTRVNRLNCSKKKDLLSSFFGLTPDLTFTLKSNLAL